MTSRNNYRNNRPTATSMDDVVPPRPKRSIKPAAKPTSPENNP